QSLPRWIGHRHFSRFNTNTRVLRSQRSTEREYVRPQGGRPVILFKPEQVEPILVGRKTQTRRTWKRPRVKVGSVHQAKTTYHDKPFARIKITGLRRQRLGDISTEDVHREGYDS